MKLSEAIRLGAMLKPQCFGSMHLYRDNRMYDAAAITASCALGAAEDAGYQDVFESLIAEPFVGHQCPACSFWHCLANVAVHLNDGHSWTRERIADWVESQEAVATPVTDNAVAEGRNAVCASATRE